MVDLPGGRKEPRGTPGLSFTRASPDPEKVNCSCNRAGCELKSQDRSLAGVPRTKKKKSKSPSKVLPSSPELLVHKECVKFRGEER